MSDHIEVDGKKYFDESYLQLANNNASRAKERSDELWKALDEATHALSAHEGWSEIVAEFHAILEKTKP